MDMERRDFLKLSGYGFLALLTGGCTPRDTEKKDTYDNWQEYYRRFYQDQNIDLSSEEVVYSRTKTIDIINASGMVLDKNALSKVYGYFENLPNSEIRGYSVTAGSEQTNVTRTVETVYDGGTIFLVPFSASVPQGLPKDNHGNTIYVDSKFITFIRIPDPYEYEKYRHLSTYEQYTSYDQFINDIFLVEACQSSLNFDPTEAIRKLNVEFNVQQDMVQEAGCNTYRFANLWKGNDMYSFPGFSYKKNGQGFILNTIPIGKNEVDAIPSEPILK
jgi:hypothetical protein